MPDGITVNHIFNEVPRFLPEELLEILVDQPDVKIDRIVSRGHASPSGFWYDDERSEFVILLKGCAGLRFQGQDDALTLKPGDYLVIPPHAKHRVDWTDADEDTVWLAVYFRQGI